MADDKKLNPEPKNPPPAKGAPLAPAGESGDPAVQKLLAERQGHALNAGLEPDPQQEKVRKDAVAAIEELDEKLAELGFTAK